MNQQPDHRSLSRRVYDALPESIKERYTFEQWSWLPDAQKHRLEAVDTEPEWSE